MGPDRTYLLIREQLERRIRAHEFGPSGRLPPEVRLAEELGVSRGTLRRALELLRRDGLIESGPGRGTFGREPVTAGRAGGKTVGVVVPLVAQARVAELISGMEGELHRRGCGMVMGDGGSSVEQQAERIAGLLAQGVAALIAYPIDFDSGPSVFEGLVARGVPFVLVDRYLPGLATDSVVADNVSGAYAAVTHLASLGHRRIAFVATDNRATSSVAERRLGYEQALAAAGLAVDSGLVLDSVPLASEWPAPPPVAARGDEQIRGFLKWARPTAVFALNDRLAMSVYRAAAAARLRVGATLSVAGFDDDQIATALSPRLTTVAQPRRAMGCLAAALVLDRLEGRRTDIARTVLPARLVVRESTSPLVV